MKADYSGFQAWLQCYYVDGMKTLRDHNGRTMWFKVSWAFIFNIFASMFSLTNCLGLFQGDPGPMAPKGKKNTSITTLEAHIRI